MFTSPIVIQTINGGAIRQVDAHRPSGSVETKVRALAKRLSSLTCSSKLTADTGRSFSPLRFLWWACLLVGARAQQTTPFPASMNLSALAGTSGFVLNGEQAFDTSGHSVASAGDVNGDGIADLVIGAYRANSNAGKTYVVFGRAGLGSSGSLALSSLNGTSGFVLNGQADDYSGYRVASAGDVNGDGIGDLVIGAVAAKFYAGRSYVVFGSAGLGSGGSLALSNLNGTNGFVLNGEQANNWCGSSVASAGDVNDDGITDLVIGAYLANSGAGKSYVVFGRAGLGSTGSLAISSLNGTTGFVLNGEQANNWSGYSVASAGDVNGDGIDDLVIGAYQATLSGAPTAGKSYVVFGGAGLGSSGSLDLSSLNGTNGFVLNGEALDNSGWSVASAGDVNNDGITDLVIGAPHSYSSKSYVVFGRAGLGSSGTLALPSLNGTSGFVLNGQGDASGFSVAGAGDVNRDGIADLVIGAYAASSFTGKSYVVFGRPGLGSSGSLALSSLNGTNGFVLNGEQANDLSGNSVAGAGDVNGDGIADLVIGAENATSGAGKSYVFFGRKLSNATFLTTPPHTPGSITSISSTSAQSTPLTSLVATALVPSTTTPKLTTLNVLKTKSSQSMPAGLSSSSLTSTSLTIGSTTLAPSSALQTPTFLLPISMSSVSNMGKATISSNSVSTITSSATNVPLIAGIAGGAGALILSIIAGVVAFLRKRSKNKNLEGAIPLPRLQVNENAKGETAKPDGQIYAGFGKVNQAEYSSARLDQQEGHYEDPNKWAKELQKNPSQANYIDVNSLEVPTEEIQEFLERIQ